eukprot:g74.t1
MTPELDFAAQQPIADAEQLGATSANSGQLALSTYPAPLSLVAGRLTRTSAKKLRDTLEKLQSATAPEDRRLVAQIGKTLQKFEDAKQLHRLELAALVREACSASAAEYDGGDEGRRRTERIRALLDLDELSEADSVLVAAKRTVGAEPGAAARVAEVSRLLADFVLQQATGVERASAELSETASSSSSAAKKNYLTNRVASFTLASGAQRALEAAVAKPRSQDAEVLARFADHLLAEERAKQTVLEQKLAQHLSLDGRAAPSGGNPSLHVALQRLADVARRRPSAPKMVMASVPPNAARALVVLFADTDVVLGPDETLGRPLRVPEPPHADVDSSFHLEDRGISPVSHVESTAKANKGLAEQFFLTPNLGISGSSHLDDASIERQYDSASKLDLMPSPASKQLHEVFSPRGGYPANFALPSNLQLYPVQEEASFSPAANQPQPAIKPTLLQRPSPAEEQYALFNKTKRVVGGADSTSVSVSVSPDKEHEGGLRIAVTPGPLFPSGVIQLAPSATTADGTSILPAASDDREDDGKGAGDTETSDFRSAVAESKDPLLASGALETVESKISLELERSAHMEQSLRDLSGQLENVLELMAKEKADLLGEAAGKAKGATSSSCRPPPQPEVGEALYSELSAKLRTAKDSGMAVAPEVVSVWARAGERYPTPMGNSGLSPDDFVPYLTADEVEDVDATEKRMLEKYTAEAERAIALGDILEIERTLIAYRAVKRIQQDGVVATTWSLDEDALVTKGHRALQQACARFVDMVSAIVVPVSTLSSRKSLEKVLSWPFRQSKSFLVQTATGTTGVDPDDTAFFATAVAGGVDARRKTAERVGLLQAQLDEFRRANADLRTKTVSKDWRGIFQTAMRAAGGDVVELQHSGDAAKREFVVPVDSFSVELFVAIEGLLHHAAENANFLSDGETRELLGMVRRRETGLVDAEDTVKVRNLVVVPTGSHTGSSGSAVSETNPYVVRELTIIREEVIWDLQLHQEAATAKHYTRDFLVSRFSRSLATLTSRVQADSSRGAEMRKHRDRRRNFVRRSLQKFVLDNVKPTDFLPAFLDMEEEGGGKPRRPRTPVGETPLTLSQFLRFRLEFVARPGEETDLVRIANTVARKLLAKERMRACLKDERGFLAVAQADSSPSPDDGHDARAQRPLIDFDSVVDMTSEANRAENVDADPAAGGSGSEEQMSLRALEDKYDALVQQEARRPVRAPPQLSYVSQLQWKLEACSKELAVAEEVAHHGSLVIEPGVEDLKLVDSMRHRVAEIEMMNVPLERAMARQSLPELAKALKGFPSPEKTYLRNALPSGTLHLLARAEAMQNSLALHQRLRGSSLFSASDGGDDDSPSKAFEPLPHVATAFAGAETDEASSFFPFVELDRSATAQKRASETKNRSSEFDIAQRLEASMELHRSSRNNSVMEQETVHILRVHDGTRDTVAETSASHTAVASPLFSAGTDAKMRAATPTNAVPSANLFARPEGEAARAIDAGAQEVTVVRQRAETGSLGGASFDVSPSPLRSGLSGGGLFASSPAKPPVADLSREFPKMAHDPFAPDFEEVDPDVPPDIDFSTRSRAADLKRAESEARAQAVRQSALEAFQKRDATALAAVLGASPSAADVCVSSSRGGDVLQNMRTALTVATSVLSAETVGEMTDAEPKLQALKTKMQDGGPPEVLALCDRALRHAFVVRKRDELQQKLDAFAALRRKMSFEASGTASTVDGAGTTSSVGAAGMSASSSTSKVFAGSSGAGGSSLSASKNQKREALDSFQRVESDKLQDMKQFLRELRRSLNRNSQSGGNLVALAASAGWEPWEGPDVKDNSNSSFFDQQPRSPASLTPAHAGFELPTQTTLDEEKRVRGGEKALLKTVTDLETQLASYTKHTAGLSSILTDVREKSMTNDAKELEKILHRLERQILLCAGIRFFSDMDLELPPASPSAADAQSVEVDMDLLSSVSALNTGRDMDLVRLSTSREGVIVPPNNPPGVEGSHSAPPPVNSNKKQKDGGGTSNWSDFQDPLLSTPQSEEAWAVVLKAGHPLLLEARDAITLLRQKINFVSLVAKGDTARVQALLDSFEKSTPAVVGGQQESSEGEQGGGAQQQGSCLNMALATEDVARAKAFLEKQKQQQESRKLDQKVMRRLEKAMEKQDAPLVTALVKSGRLKPVDLIVANNFLRKYGEACASLLASVEAEKAGLEKERRKLEVALENENDVPAAPSRDVLLRSAGKFTEFRERAESLQLHGGVPDTEDVADEDLGLDKLLGLGSAQERAGTVFADEKNLLRLLDNCEVAIAELEEKRVQMEELRASSRKEALAKGEASAIAVATSPAVDASDESFGQQREAQASPAPAETHVPAPQAQLAAPSASQSENGVPAAITGASGSSDAAAPLSKQFPALSPGTGSLLSDGSLFELSPGGLASARAAAAEEVAQTMGTPSLMRDSVAKQPNLAGMASVEQELEQDLEKTDLSQSVHVDEFEGDIAPHVEQQPTPVGPTAATPARDVIGDDLGLTDSPDLPLPGADEERPVTTSSVTSSSPGKSSLDHSQLEHATARIQELAAGESGDAATAVSSAPAEVPVENSASSTVREHEAAVGAAVARKDSPRSELERVILRLAAQDGSTEDDCFPDLEAAIRAYEALPPELQVLDADIQRARTKAERVRSSSEGRGAGSVPEILSSPSLSVTTAIRQPVPEGEQQAGTAVQDFFAVEEGGEDDFFKGFDEGGDGKEENDPIERGDEATAADAAAKENGTSGASGGESIAASEVWAARVNAETAAKEAVTVPPQTEPTPPINPTGSPAGVPPPLVEVRSFSHTSSVMRADAEDVRILDSLHTPVTPSEPNEKQQVGSVLASLRQSCKVESAEGLRKSINDLNALPESVQTEIGENRKLGYRKKLRRFEAAESLRFSMEQESVHIVALQTAILMAERTGVEKAVLEDARKVLKLAEALKDEKCAEMKKLLEKGILLSEQFCVLNLIYFPRFSQKL